EYIIVADSEYVVKGITEWVSDWRANDWRNKQRRRPATLSLLRRLEDAVASYENQGLIIRFLHVSREYNKIADSLAKGAVPALSV
ncbi:hypothetical protein C8R43DRAFT_906819, partial [Mycena crocata]